MPFYKVEDSQLERITIDGVDNIFVMSNPHLEDIHFDRGLVGIEFSQACLTASKLFLAHFKPELSVLLSDLAEMVILSKGLIYRFSEACSQTFNHNLEINFAATRRLQVESESAKIDVAYVNFDAPAENLILGDVIATGATICAVLSRYLESYKLKRVFILSMAGSIVGAQTIAKFCKSKNIELTLVYASAAFGLGSNGFDLSFLHPDTITSKIYRDRAMQAYKGKPVSSVGWDCGTQVLATRKYKMLCWIEAKYWDMEDSDVFPVKEFPSDKRLVEKERSAYEDRVSSFPS